MKSWGASWCDLHTDEHGNLQSNLKYTATRASFTESIVFSPSRILREEVAVGLALDQVPLHGVPPVQPHHHVHTPRRRPVEVSRVPFAFFGKTEI